MQRYRLAVAVDQLISVWLWGGCWLSVGGAIVCPNLAVMATEGRDAAGISSCKHGRVHPSKRHCARSNLEEGSGCSYGRSETKR